MNTENKIIEDLSERIIISMQAQEVPGLALAVVKDDQIVFAGGFGKLKVSCNVPVDEHSIFAIGSLTKAFTATAIGLLVQDGALSWDDSVVDYLPGFQMYDPYVTQALNIRDLLCHRSGLATWAGDLIWYGSTYSGEEVLRRVRYIPPAFPFRAGYGYANMMFLAAGHIVQNISGQFWNDFIQDRLFKPLCMNRSNTSVSKLNNLNNVALPHQKAGETTMTVPYRISDNSAPCGAINASVHDLAQWLKLQLGEGCYQGERLIDQAIINETHQVHNSIRIPKEQHNLVPFKHFNSYGLGWFLFNYRGRFVVSHGGAIDGMLSYIGFLPEEKLGIVVLTNKYPNSLIQSLFYQITDAYLKAPFHDWIQAYHVFNNQQELKTERAKEKFNAERVAGAPPSLQLKSFTGDYSNALYGDCQVTFEDDRLNLHPSAHPQVHGKLEHWHYDTFICHWSDPVWEKSMVPFISDGGGKVKGFSFKVLPDYLDPLEYYFERK